MYSLFKALIAYGISNTSVRKNEGGRRRVGHRRTGHRTTSVQSMMRNTLNPLSHNKTLLIAHQQSRFCSTNSGILLLAAILRRLQEIKNTFAMNNTLFEYALRLWLKYQLARKIEGTHWRCRPGDRDIDWAWIASQSSQSIVSQWRHHSMSRKL